MPFPFSLSDPPPQVEPDLYRLPETFTAGDLFQFRFPTTQFPPSAGWSMQLSLRGVADSQIDINSILDGDYLLKETPEATASWVVGSYKAQLYAVLGFAKRTTIFNLPFEVIDNLSATDAAVDLRSNAEKILEAIEATMLGRAGNDILDSQIDQTTFRRMTPEQLQTAHSYWSAKVRSERAQARAKAGLATGRTILTRFVRPA